MPRWFFYSLMTMLLWGGWGVVSKPVSTTMSPWQVQCLSTIGLLPVLIVLAVTQLRNSDFKFRIWEESGRALWLAFAGGVISSVGNIACYQALATGGKAAAVIPLTSLYPLVTIILARRLLKERLNAVQWGGIVASFAALGYFITVGAKKSFAWLSPWLAMALVPIVLWGVSDFLQKLATGHASSERVTLSPSCWAFAGGRADTDVRTLRLADIRRDVAVPVPAGPVLRPGQSHADYRLRHRRTSLRGDADDQPLLVGHDSAGRADAPRANLRP